MSEAQSQVLKSLANKMYMAEVKSYEKGETKEKPKPLAKEVKQTKKEVKEMADKKVDSELKKIVQGFFKGKKSERPTYVAMIEAKKPKLRGGSSDCGPGSKRKGKKSKKAII